MPSIYLYFGRERCHNSFGHKKEGLPPPFPLRLALSDKSVEVEAWVIFPELLRERV
jgi:hypothetical protein